VGFRRASRTEPTSLPRVWVAWVPRGVLTPSGHSRSRREPAHCCANPPSMHLPIPFRGPSQHPRTDPGARRLRSSDDASFPGLSCPSTHAGAADPFRAGFHPRAVPRPRFGYLPRGVHHRPSGSLAAPERPRAFLFEAFSSRRSDSLPEAHALLPLRASIRLAPIGACGRDRLQGLDPDESSFWPSHPCGRDASMPPWGSSLQSVLLLRPCERFVDSRSVPHHALGGIDVPNRLRLEVFRSGGVGIAPFGAAGSPGICHLATVAASREPSGRAGSWFRLAARGVYAPRTDPSPLRSDPTQG
jgi:hypothetical protein